MNICIIGYGKMGKEVEKIAKQRNHQIPLIIDMNNQKDINLLKQKNIDIAIEFSTPDAAFNNYQKCFEYNVPVVSGTTGWTDALNEIVEMCTTQKKSFFYASNFSLGVNILFDLNERLAKIMKQFPEYKIHIHEIHHKHKKDAPSGTAISLAKDIIKNREDINDWSQNEPPEADKILISSERKDEIPGTHTIQYQSEIDVLQLNHEAKNRKGFALGAVLAAEFLKGKTGYYTMKDLLNL